MDKAVRFLGLMSCALLIFGSIFKVMHYPGAAFGILSGGFCFAFLFIPSLIIANFRNASDSGLLENILYAAGHLAGGVFILGLLFKLMLWPHATLLLMISLTVLVFAILPGCLTILLTKKTDSIQEESTRKDEINRVLIAFVFFAMAFALMNLNGPT